MNNLYPKCVCRCVCCLCCCCWWWCCCECCWCWCCWCSLSVLQSLQELILVFSWNENSLDLYLFVVIFNLKYTIFLYYYLLNSFSKNLKMSFKNHKFLQTKLRKWLQISNWRKNINIKLNVLTIDFIYKVDVIFITAITK